MRRALLVLLLIVTVTPFATELIELGVHLVWHGDDAHAADGDHHDATGEDDEHGCSPLFHACGCHASTLVPPAGASPLELAVFSSDDGGAPPPVLLRSRCDDPPPLRPPIV